MRDQTKVSRPDERTPQSPAPDPGRPAAERRHVAWIGRGVQIEGRVVSTEDLTIDGRVDGSIELGDHSLLIGADAAIKADLAAKNITIQGAVTGNVQAHERLELGATGSVVGDITAPRFVMTDGAIVTGNVDVGGAPKR
jgi:cytoskeletal protein CcmA (bactofilin family)